MNPTKAPEIEIQAGQRPETIPKKKVKPTKKEYAIMYYEMILRNHDKYDELAREIAKEKLNEMGIKT